MKINKLQNEVDVWAKEVFKNTQPYRALLCVFEEIGELAHAQLKQEQGIRLNENHTENAKDACADILIALCHYCSLRGFNLEKIVEKTWPVVKARKYNTDPNCGGQTEKRVNNQ